MGNSTNHYNNFEEFMQASIDAASLELEKKHGISIISIIESSKEAQVKFAKIIRDTVNGPHNYEQRLKQLSENRQDVEPLIKECASSIMLQVVLSDIF